MSMCGHTIIPGLPSPSPSYAQTLWYTNSMYIQYMYQKKSTPYTQNLNLHPHIEKPEIQEHNTHTTHHTSPISCT